MSITLSHFERIDGLLTRQIRAGQFETCADPSQYIITSKRKLNHDKRSKGADDASD